MIQDSEAQILPYEYSLSACTGIRGGSCGSSWSSCYNLLQLQRSVISPSQHKSGTELTDVIPGAVTVADSVVAFVRGAPSIRQEQAEDTRAA